ncbi:MAG: methionine--tRNA ligase subunit beta, partial [Chloroflexi bacterium]|nr:methionine--tRNA ligase subunit beta [Chloroflexota bacterium]
YRAAWIGLSISYDRFIRTTDDDHVRAVQHVFQKLQQNGDIYKGVYEGWYCVPCETFFTDAPDDVCPECGRPVDRVRQDAYFFALSRYQDRLLKLYQEQPEFVVPTFRRNEVVRFIEQGLRDMCVTRQRTGWGIPVPGDPSHVIYVWFEALVNYLAACGYPDDRDRLTNYWPAGLHVVGKDILVRFHATLWPAMLMGLGEALPRQILAHGWLMIDGQKMSKSRMAEQIAKWSGESRGPLTVVSLRPDELVRSLQEQAGIPLDRNPIAVDALRYFLVRDLPPGADSEFSPDRLVERYNSDLANDLGNLLNRTLSMLQRYRDSGIPAVSEGPLADEAGRAVERARAAYEGQQAAEALHAAWDLVGAANQHIAREQPWVLHREGRDGELDTVLYALGEVCRVTAVIAAPVMPSAALEILRQLGLPAGPAELLWERTSWGGWPADGQAPAATDSTRQEQRAPSSASKERSSTVDAPGAAPGAAPVVAPADTPAEITIEDFARVRLRVATIREAERVEGAKKLLRLTVDLGDEQRQIVSGIAEVYTPESLIGRQVAIIVNLKPATIRGVKSYGMLLAADLDGKAILLQPDQQVPPGSPVR